MKRRGVIVRNAAGLLVYAESCTQNNMIAIPFLHIYRDLATGPVIQEAER